MLDPSTLFDESFYLATNLDVAQAVTNGNFTSGFDHFNRFGELERRDPSALFDTTFYLDENSDVAAAVERNEVTAFDHFILFGQEEERNPSPLFNPEYYLLKNPDVAAVVERDELTGIEHFVRFGQFAGRDPSALFNTPYYLGNNPDVAAAVERHRDELTGIEHFVAYGQSEGRDPSTLFDTSSYLETNPDVAAAVSSGAFASAIDHFLQFGRQEGRASLAAFDLSEPTGPYEVGTVSLPLVDTAREETLTSDPNDKRELLVQIWYPAAAPAANPGSYVDPVTAQAIAQSLNLSPDLIGLIRPEASPTAVISGTQANYPVLLFSHGVGQFRNQNTFQVEELASHGYIVVGISHTYIAGVTAFPDGRVIPFDRSLIPDNVTEFGSALSRAIEVTAADASSVLDELERLNTNDPNGLLTGRLNLTQAGIFGHSLGGITATVAMQLDNRFRAGINMDGPILGDLATAPINQPFMLMNAQEPYRNSVVGELVESLDQRQSVYERLENAGYNLTIQGTEHENFSDRSLLLPLSSIYAPEQFAAPGAVDIGVSRIGAIDGRRVTRIINAYTRAFFDQHLKNEEQLLLDRASPNFPEVQFASRSPEAV